LAQIFDRAATGGMLIAATPQINEAGVSQIRYGQWAMAEGDSGADEFGQSFREPLTAALSPFSSVLTNCGPARANGRL